MISVNTKGKGFFDLENETIIIPKENLNGALDNDEVVVKLVNKKNDDLGYVEKIIKRNTVKVIGTLTIVKKVVVVTLDEERLNNYKIKVVNADKFKLVNGLKALFKIVKYPYVNKNRKSLIMEVAIEQIIGHKDDPGVDILSILLSYEIDPVFPEAVLNQVKKSHKKLVNLVKGKKRFNSFRYSYY